MLTEEQKKRIEQENKRIADTINNIGRRIVVFSGKGGVGKTTVSINLACGLKILGYRAGILDADITGPNVSQMLGVKENLMISSEKILPHTKYGIEIISLANMISADEPVILRGPMRSKIINQFLADVEWGKLDYLIADLPPGTGDEVMTMSESLKPELAIIVTTPQEVSLIDSRRAVAMAKKMGIPNVALIENMSGFLCPGCGCKIDLFGSGGGKAQAAELNIEFLGALPIDINARETADKGVPIVVKNINSEVSAGIIKIIERIVSQVEFTV